jgi:hypothetical protein
VDLYEGSGAHQFHLGEIGHLASRKEHFLQSGSMLCQQWCTTTEYDACSAGESWLILRSEVFLLHQAHREPTLSLHLELSHENAQFLRR